MAATSTTTKTRQLASAFLQELLTTESRQLNLGLTRGVFHSLPPDMQERGAALVPDFALLKLSGPPSADEINGSTRREMIISDVIAHAPQVLQLTSLQRTIIHGDVESAAQQAAVHPKKQISKLSRPILSHLRRMAEEIWRDTPTEGLDSSRSLQKIMRELAIQIKIARQNGEAKALVVLVGISSPGPFANEAVITDAIDRSDKLTRIWQELETKGFSPCIAKVVIEKWPVGSGMTSFGFEYHIGVDLRERR